MNANEYQQQAHRSAIYPLERSIEYVALGLASEAGEVAGKIKKQIRDCAKWTGEQREDHRRAILNELGDVLWYCAELAHCFGAHLGDVMIDNLDKLRLRQRTGTLQGSGDDREKRAALLSGGQVAVTVDAVVAKYLPAELAGDKL